MSRPPRIEEDGTADDGDLPQSVQEALAGAVQPAELGAGQRERMRRRVLQQAHEQPPEGTRTLRAGEGAWIQISRSWRSASCTATTVPARTRASCACARAA